MLPLMSVKLYEDYMAVTSNIYFFIFIPASRKVLYYEYNVMYIIKKFKLFLLFFHTYFPSDLFTLSRHFHEGFVGLKARAYTLS